MVENQAKHWLKRNARCTLISGWGELFSKWENLCLGQHSPKANCVPLNIQYSEPLAYLVYNNDPLYLGRKMIHNHVQQMVSVKKMRASPEP